MKTPLENPSIYGGNGISRRLTPIRRGGPRVLSFLAGFTFIEIMLVVVIIAVLAAIAIPNLLRSRLNANENAAISSLQTVSVTAHTFMSVNNVFPTTLAQLSAANFIDNALGCATATCTKDGYTFGMGGTGLENDFFVFTVPQTPNITGRRSFCSGSDGTLRFSAAGATPGTQAACTAWNPL